MAKHEEDEPKREVGEKLSRINRKTLKSEVIKKDDPPTKRQGRGYSGRHREQGG